MQIALIVLLLGSCFGDVSPQRSCPPLAGQFRDILSEQGVVTVEVFAPPGEARDQRARYGGACAQSALERATSAILHRRWPQSPGALAEDRADCGPDCFFDVEGALFGLVADAGSALEHQLLPLPPGRDDVAEHWVFFLSVPSLSRHGHWILVPREGGALQFISQP